ncbi:MAG TPA: four helix bundle protein [Bacteroidales bacterium]|nr:four helix bundle protein [Bacteroidales bacterium]
MATIKSLEELQVWKHSRELVNEVYRGLDGCDDHAFRDQICRSAISVMNNIAEGFERNGNREFIQFLKISKGSGGKLKSMLYLGEDLGYFDKETASKLRNDIDKIIFKTGGLIKHLKQFKTRKI